MPITGSLGALSYSRGGGILNWALTLGSDLQFSDLLLNDTSLYTVGYNNGPVANYPDPEGDTSVVKIGLNNNPIIEWQTQLDPTINKFEVTSVNGVTETLFVATPPFLNASNLPIGTPVRFFGAVYGGVTGDIQTYYIIARSLNSFQISLAPGGSPVNLSTSSGSMFVIPQTAEQSGYLQTNRLAYDTTQNNLLITGTFNSVTMNINVRDGNGFYGTTTFVTSQGVFDFNFKNFRSEIGTNANTDMETFDVVPISATEYICSSRYKVGTPSTRVDVLTKFNSSGTVLLQEEIASSTFTAPLPRLLKLSNNDIIMTQQLVTSNPAVGDRYSIQNIDPSNFNVNWQLNLNYLQGQIVDIIKDSNDNIFIITISSSIIKTNSSGTVLYQKNLAIGSIQKGIIDSNDDLYIVGSNGTVIKITGSTGAVDWSNILSLSNVTTPATGLTISVQSLAIDATSVYVLANLKTGSTFKAGAIYKLPNDGTIPGSGVYLIDNPDTVYDLNYQTNAVSSTTTSYTFNTSTYALDPFTSDSDLSTFTNSVGTLSESFNRLA